MDTHLIVDSSSPPSSSEKELLLNVSDYKLQSFSFGCDGNRVVMAASLKDKPVSLGDNLQLVTF